MYLPGEIIATILDNPYQRRILSTSLLEKAEQEIAYMRRQASLPITLEEILQATKENTGFALRITSEKYYRGGAETIWIIGYIRDNEFELSTMGQVSLYYGKIGDFGEEGYKIELEDVEDDALLHKEFQPKEVDFFTYYRVLIARRIHPKVALTFIREMYQDLLRKRTLFSGFYLLIRSLVLNEDIYEVTNESFEELLPDETDLPQLEKSLENAHRTVEYFLAGYINEYEYWMVMELDMGTSCDELSYVLEEGDFFSFRYYKQDDEEPRLETWPSGTSRWDVGYYNIQNGEIKIDQSKLLVFEVKEELGFHYLLRVDAQDEFDTCNYNTEDLDFFTHAKLLAYRGVSQELIDVHLGKRLAALKESTSFEAQCEKILFFCSYDSLSQIDMYQFANEEKALQNEKFQALLREAHQEMERILAL